jgi:hypothetical protein
MCGNVSVMIVQQLSDYRGSVLRTSINTLAMKPSNSSSE